CHERVSGRAYRPPSGEAVAEMPVGNEDRFGPAHRQRRMTLMLDDANNLVPFRLGRRNPQQYAFTDGRLAAERTRREILVDDDLPRQIATLIDVVVGIGEGSA